MSDPDRGGSAPAKLVFQDWIDVIAEPVRSRSFHCASGGVQLRVGAVWLDAGDREPIDAAAWPTRACTVTLVQAGTPERRLASARVSLENTAKLRWSELPVAEYAFVFESENHDARHCLYVEFAVATFAGSSAPPGPDAGGGV